LTTGAGGNGEKQGKMTTNVKVRGDGDERMEQPGWDLFLKTVKVTMERGKKISNHGGGEV